MGGQSTVTHTHAIRVGPRARARGRAGCSPGRVDRHAPGATGGRAHKLTLRSQSSGPAPRARRVDAARRWRRGSSFTGWPHFVTGVRCSLGTCGALLPRRRDAIRDGHGRAEINYMLRHALFFHSERPRHSRRLRPISYLGAARFTVTVFRAPCAGRVRARSARGGMSRPTVGVRVFSTHGVFVRASLASPPAPPVRRPARTGTRRRGAGRARPLALQATRPKGERQTRFTGASPSLRPLVAA